MKAEREILEAFGAFWRNGSASLSNPRKSKAKSRCESGTSKPGNDARAKRSARPRRGLPGI